MNAGLPPAEALASLLRQTLAAGGRVRLLLQGRSMTPTLPSDCEIEAAPLAGPAPLGALVIFVADGRLVAHRLVRRAGDRWVTQGDGRPLPDAPLTADQIIGVVAAAYRDGRRCWPGPGERWLARFWRARHHARRLLRRLRGARRKPEDDAPDEDPRRR